MDRVEHSDSVTHRLSEAEEDELLALLEDDELALMKKAHDVEKAAKQRLAELRARGARRG